jgi:hypothetical protein
MEELIARLGEPAVQKAAAKRMEAALLIIEDGARVGSPVNMGLLRSSWTHRVETSSDNVQGIVGNPVEYAPMQEFGTGTLCDGPGGSSSPHFPPPQALARWAELHGMPGAEYAIAKAIFLRGGLKPQRMLRNSLETNRGAAEAQLLKVLDDVAQAITSGGSAT